MLIIKKTSTHNRLAEMGFVEGVKFRIVRRVSGMIQIRLDGSDVVIREDLLKYIDYDDC